MDADVAIVGSGPVGSALAIILARAGRRVILLDRATFPRDKPCGEGLMPAGARVLAELGIDLSPFPPLQGVTYHVPGAGRVDGGFTSPGRGVRRVAFDALLAEVAATTANVEAQFACPVTGIAAEADGVTVTTSAGTLRARLLVGADGHRSQVARSMGWDRPARPPHRHALVSHFDAPGHGFDRVIVTLLAGCETYLAPTTDTQVLLVVMGAGPALRRDAYAALAAEAHPELAGCRHEPASGASRFATRPATITEGRVALIGDAAGFVDPLTGDGITAGLLAARRLGALVNSHPHPLDAYRAWERRQWRRRAILGRLALLISGSPGLARRAIRGLGRRPGTLDRLLLVNEGSRGLGSLTPRDWAALGGA